MTGSVPALDVLFAVTAGVATFFSPCAYALLPGYVGFYASQEAGGTLRGSLLRGVTAGFGVLLTFVVAFGLVFAVGYRTFSGIELLEPVVGAVLVVFGAAVLFDRAPSLSISLPKRRTNAAGFGVFGAGYAVAAIGCVVPLFVGVVGRALSLSAGGALLVLGTYAGTVLALMVAMTVTTGVGMNVSTGRALSHGRNIKRLAGGLMVVAGFGQLYLAIFVLGVF